MDRELDVFTNYRNITNKVKKRFLKKPNYTEASDQFGTLTRVLKQQECPQYAGFCCLAKARYESVLGNTTAEIESLLEAARLFFDAEKANVEVKCPALDEHVSESVHCYNQAVKAYQKEGNVSLAGLVALEAANSLAEIGKLEEASSHYLRASDLLKEFSIVDSICSLKRAAYCKVYNHHYQAAIKLLTKAASTIESLVDAEADALTYSVSLIREEVEITRVLLLLVVNCSPHEHDAESLKLLEKFAWEGGEDDRILSEDLFLLIQSVVMATQARDVEALEGLEGDLFEYLNVHQIDLLHKIVSMAADDES